MLNASMGFNAGDVLGDYRVIGVLGVGGMGAVYKVKHLISDRTEALKVLLPDLQGYPELAERFVREIRMQAALSHPAIAALHNAFRLDNQLLMVMEFVEGDGLDVFLKRERMQLESAVDFTLQVLSALAYAHSRGVIHRDIKPANIMLTPQRTIKLMDFGIARLTEDVRITQTGLALGSLYYMAPEQVRGHAVDARSDLYSLGILFYEMATGERPIRAENSFDVMEAHLNKAPRPPESVNPQISPMLSAAIMRAIEKDPANRYQTATDFSTALEDVRRRATHPQLRPQTTPGLYESDLQATRLASSQQRFAVPDPSQFPGFSKQSVPFTAVREATPPGQSGTPPGQSGTPQTPRFLFDPERLERVKRDLAAHIGPVARLLVDRTARKSTSWKQLYETLASEIPAGRERERFLASRPTNF